MTGVSVSGSSSASSSVEAGALRLGIEAADGFDLVAEEVDADGAVHLRRVDVEDAAAKRDLAGHLDDVDAGVADGEQMLDQHVGHVLFAALADAARARRSSRAGRAACRRLRRAR